MKINKDTICEDTLYIVKEYYQLNTEPLFDVLSDDCVWLGIGNLLVCGASAIKAQFRNGFIIPTFEMEEPNFRRIDTGTEEQLMVLGEYTLYSDKGAKMIASTKQRLTFCYRKEADSYKLYHMHVSNEYSDLTEDEIFPIHISRQTYKYVQNILKESAKSRIHKLNVKYDGSTSFIDPSLVLYIEAMERNSILHLFNENRLVQTSIKELEEEVPAYFYRLHRSYFVNCDYVAKIERYKLTMITGEELPIPKKRFMEIREAIMKKAKKKG